jgi:hypothetical protein
MGVEVVRPLRWHAYLHMIINATRRIESNGKPRMLLDMSASPQMRRSSAATFTGEAYTPAGVLYDNLTDTSLPWVKYDLSAGVITQEAGPPSEPWGANESWRKKSDFAGAIYF